VVREFQVSCFRLCFGVTVVTVVTVVSIVGKLVV